MIYLNKSNNPIDVITENIAAEKINLKSAQSAKDARIIRTKIGRLEKQLKQLKSETPRE